MKMKVKNMLRTYVMLIVTISCLQFGSILNAQPEKSIDDFRRTHQNMLMKNAKKLVRVNSEMTKNQEKYDILYYKLVLEPNAYEESITGAVQVIGKILADSLESIELNLIDGLTVDSIYNKGHSLLSYSHANDLLVVQFDFPHYRDEEFEFIVVYNGKPHFESFFFAAYKEVSNIWTLSEPYGGRGWWPSKDVPADKADSVDIIVKVPSNMVVASNGTLTEKIKEEGATTYHWKEKYPITTYLVSLAIYPYEVHTDYLRYSETDSMEVQYYVFPDLYAERKSKYDLTIEMLEFYSGLFGEYPFIQEKYGLADVHDDTPWAAAMEHQTIMTLLNDGYYGYDNYFIGAEYLLAHEIVHQWWGDMITCETFHDIWLNEGFATYGEALWYEYQYPDKGAGYYQSQYNKYLGSGSVFVEELTDVNTIFDFKLTYQKSSWILHMLRHVVGDETFFDILKQFGSSVHQYGTAATEDFRKICEDVSGMDLRQFFEQWIYWDLTPRYYFDWDYQESGGKYSIDLTIEQKTEGDAFWMPIDVTVSHAGGEELFIVWDSIKTQQFSLEVDFEPTGVELDRDNWILAITREYDLTGFGDKSFAENSSTLTIYPNPFTGITTIEFYQDRAGHAALTIYNSQGRMIEQQSMGFVPEGNHQIIFDGSGLRSGLYFYELKTDSTHEIRRMIVE